MLYFLLSYAHGDARDNAGVKQFFEDLSAEILLWAPRLEDPHVGFLDTDILVGEPWSKNLVKALSTCQVFVALCSPAYFRSRPCGREWTVFAQRLAEQERLTGAASPALVPLLWVPMPKMPRPASRYQFADPTLGAAYLRYGVRDLVRMPEYRSDYLRFVSAFGQRILDIAARSTVPAYTGSVEFDDVSDAFAAAAAAAAAAAGAAGAAAAAPGPAGPPGAAGVAGVVAPDPQSAAVPRPGVNTTPVATDLAKRAESLGVVGMRVDPQPRRRRLMPNSNPAEPGGVGC